MIAVLLSVLPSTGSAETMTPQSGALEAEIQFDKVFYHFDDTFNARIVLVNHLIESLQTNLKMLIYPKTSDPVKPDVNQPAIFEQSWRGVTISPGGQEIIFSKDIDEIFQVPGAYPVRLLVTGKGAQNLLTDVLSFIIVFDNSSLEKEPLSCCFIFPIRYELSQRPDGAFPDTTLANALNPDSVDGLNQVLKSLSAEKMAQFTIAVPGGFIDELEAVVGGFEYYEGQNKIAVGPASPETASAKLALESLKTLSRQSNVSFATSLYASTPLPVLLRLGWERDAIDQWLRSCDKLAEMGASRMLPMFADGVELTSKELEFLAKQDIRATIVPGSIFAGQKPSGAIKLQTANKSLDILIQNNEACEVFGLTSTEQNLQTLWAILAVHHLEWTAKTREIVVIVPQKWQPTNAFINRLFSRIAGTSWITTLTAQKTAAATGKAVKAKLKKNTSGIEAGLDQAYLAQLREARQKYYEFNESVRGQNDARRGMQKYLFAAESPTRLSKDSDVISRNIFIDAIDSVFLAEVSKLNLVAEPLLTLSGMSGRVPLAITNKNSYRMYGDLEIAGKNFFFPEGPKQRIVIEPKENIYTIPLQAREAGKSPVEIKIMVGKEVVDQTIVNVKTTDFNRTAAVIIGLIIIIILAYLANRGVRGRSA